jgi:hypothetical protein
MLEGGCEPQTDFLGSLIINIIATDTYNMQSSQLAKKMDTIEFVLKRKSDSLHHYIKINEMPKPGPMQKPPILLKK